ncbi:MAG: Peptide deformylase [Candidatus Saccharicenans subterraneus]|uniref:Peptide deformylase n=1 Tax=Candidatus Saccharicenans subterraneus TaxID=2508984 RepID=A0A3E2BMM0_9BACT|nr:MAG: Peptide deformylase [Candidatus Saccharicenans subterraneum]
MALLEIITIGHPTLARRALPVENINQEIVELARNMVETMHHAPGIGLAAPQVNVSLRLITVDLSVGENQNDLIIMVNPEIIEAEGEQVGEEGCLSVPGIYEKVVRPSRILLRGNDLDGREIKLEASDLLARVFCHEIDHLDGKLFVDRLSPLKRRLIRGRLKKELDKN